MDELSLNPLLLATNTVVVAMRSLIYAVLSGASRCHCAILVENIKSAR